MGHKPRIKRGPPTSYTPEQLSRLEDWMSSIQDPKIRLEEWEKLPMALRIEYRWSIWTYVPKAPTLRLVE